MTKPENGYKFKVNGEQFETAKPDLTALEILTIAKQGGAIPNNPEEYALKGDKGEYRGNDPVNLMEDDVFITVPVGSTPVS